MNRSHYPFIIFLSLLIVGSCGDQFNGDSERKASPKGLRATLSSIQKYVFNTSCATGGCHSGINPEAGLDLTDGQSYRNLVGIGSTQSKLKLVKKGDSDSSWLIMKLEADDTSIMPPKRELASSTIDTIALWIDRGARDL